MGERPSGGRVGSGQERRARVHDERGPYTSRIIKAGAIIGDTLALLHNWDPNLDDGANLAHIRHANILSKTTRSRLEDELSILRQRGLRTANVYMGLVGAWSGAELLVLPLYLQLALHYSPVLTGLAMAPQGVVGFLGASSGARLARRAGLRTVLVVAGVSAAAGLFLLASFLVTRSYPLLLVGFLAVGYGTATAAFGATVAATRGIADEEQGLAGGLINMSRQIGAAIGVAAAAALIGTASTSGGAVDPDRTALLVIAVAAVAATVAAGRRAAGLRQAT